MEDIQNIIYIIFVVIFVIVRLIQGAKKMQEGKGQPKPASTPPPVVERRQSQPEPVLRERPAKPVAKPKTEIKQKVLTPVKKASVPPVKLPVKIKKNPVGVEIAGQAEFIPKEEGGSGLTQKIKEVHLQEETVKQGRNFDYDPREAFLIKTLLERHPSV